jgi:D-alanyl-D-alanine carboxypeptidase
MTALLAVERGAPDAWVTVSARDLLALTRGFLAVPALAELAARERVVLVTERGRRLGAPKRNSLLGRVRGLTGVKTGTTEGAGQCVIARAWNNLGFALAGRCLREDAEAGSELRAPGGTPPTPPRARPPPPAA